MNHDDITEQMKKAFDLLTECIELNNLKAVPTTLAILSILAMQCVDQKCDIKEYISTINKRIKFIYKEIKKQEEK